MEEDSGPHHGASTTRELAVKMTPLVHLSAYALDGAWLGRRQRAQHETPSGGVCRLNLLTFALVKITDKRGRGDAQWVMHLLGKHGDPERNKTRHGSKVCDLSGGRWRQVNP